MPHDAEATCAECGHPESEHVPADQATDRSKGCMHFSAANTFSLSSDYCSCDRFQRKVDPRRNTT
jgi:hypothetical protein